MSIRRWSTQFLKPAANNRLSSAGERRALIILNQPFCVELLTRVWNTCQWHACADGGANRLWDALQANPSLNSNSFLPDLIKGDLDSLRSDVRQNFAKLGVPIVEDRDQDSTDLMKCMSSIEGLESSTPAEPQFTVIILGGLSGRFDQTIHTVSYLHKLRKRRKHTFVVTDENVAWCLDAGEHLIEIDATLVGPTCGLLPLGIDSTILTTRGLKWDLENKESSFDGMVSTSNAAADREVYISTTKPIVWNIELAFL